MKKTLALFAGLALSACLALPASALTLRLGHNAAEGNPKWDASLLFAELVEKKSEGRVTVEVGGAAQFGDDVEMLTALRLGTLDISANSQGPTAGVVPEFGAVGLPFLFSELPQAWKVLDGPIGETLKAKAEEKGLVVLAFWDNGIRHISNNVRPIETPEDLKGLKIRTPADPATIDAFTALGANPTPMKFSELYLALQQGVVDGQENPLMNIYSSKLYEVQKYISFTGHKYEMTVFVVSKTVWDGLAPEDQAVLQEAALEAGQYNRRRSQEADAELEGKLREAGVEFNDADVAAFQELTKSVYDKWRAELGEFVTELQQAAADARQ